MWLNVIITILYQCFFLLNYHPSLQFMTLLDSIEILSVVFGLFFLILLIKENIWCWLFGILSSAMSVYLFIAVKLYSEALLYFFYVIIGCYGWITWSKNKSIKSISSWKMIRTALAFIVGALGASGLALFFSKFTDAKFPVLDATTTSFSFVASFLEAHKIIQTWWFWIVINALSVWLYWLRDLELYSGLMIIYTVLSIIGYYKWNQILKTDENHA